MPATKRQYHPPQRHTRAGVELPRSTDGRTITARRYRKLIDDFTAELGGSLSAADAALVRQAATLTLRAGQVQADVVMASQLMRTRWSGSAPRRAGSSACSAARPPPISPPCRPWPTTWRSRQQLRFAHAVRRQFDADPKMCAQAMAVSRAYAQRPEVYTRLSWNALVALSSPTLPDALRARLEARILAGERIGAPEIWRVRGRLKNGRPRRPANQLPADRMAA